VKGNKLHRSCVKREWTAARLTGNAKIEKKNEEKAKVGDNG